MSKISVQSHPTEKAQYLGMEGVKVKVNPGPAMGGEGVGGNGDPGKGGGEGPGSHGPSGIGGGGTGPGFSLGVRGGVPRGGFAGRGIGVDAFGGVIGVCGRGIEGAVS